MEIHSQVEIPCNSYRCHGNCLIKLTKKCLKASFLEGENFENEGTRMKRFWSSFKSGREYQEQILKFSLPPLEGGNFLCFSTYQNLDYRISKNMQAKLCGFIRDNKKGPLKKCTKFHWDTWNQMAEAMIWKLPVFKFFFKMSLFEIQSVFLARHHG